MRNSLLSHLAHLCAAVNLNGLDYDNSLIIVQRKRHKKMALSSSRTAMSDLKSNPNTALLLSSSKSNAIMALSFSGSSERVMGRWYTFPVSNVVSTSMQKPVKPCTVLMPVAKKRIANASAL
jgi:hypothetical protein